MRKLLFAAFAVASTQFVACSSGEQEKVQSAEATVAAPVSESQPETTEEEAVEEVVKAVCIWDKISVREEAGEKAKWLTSLNLGEKVNFLNESKKLTEGSKEREYVKIQLLDGKEGWVRTEFVIPGAKGAALIQDADIYKRPDLLTKTDKSYSAMDIVAVIGEQGDFLEVTGKRSEGTWIESGYIKKGNVSYNDVDIAVAKFGNAALSVKNKEEKIKKLKEVVDNSDFSGSAFISKLNDALTDLELPEMPEETPSEASDLLPEEEMMEDEMIDESEIVE